MYVAQRLRFPCRGDDRTSPTGRNWLRVELLHGVSHDRCCCRCRWVRGIPHCNVALRHILMCLLVHLARFCNAARRSNSCRDSGSSTLYRIVTAAIVMMVMMMMVMMII